MVEIVESALYQGGIELGARASPHLRGSLSKGNGFVVRALVDHRIDGIDNREYARAEWNILAAQTTWVSRPVILFMMRINDVRRTFQKFNIAQELEAILGVPAHDLPFFVIEFCWFPENTIRNF